MNNDWVFVMMMSRARNIKIKEKQTIEISNQIKTLRLHRGITQDEMAQHFGVTAQAISKWERGVATPDISLLPGISAYFGVTIDELFALTDDTKMERIENMLCNVRFVPEAEFVQYEQYLKDCIARNDLTGKATLLLAMLYNKRANEYHELAKPLAREALRRNPEDIRNYFWLLDLLIADGRTVEARDYAERMKRVEYSYHYEMYMGYICKMECDLPAALVWWQKMTEHSPEKWVVWAEYADCMAKLCRYDEAIKYYKKAMPMRPEPRYIDCEQAVAQICEIRGDISGAIEMYRQMLQVTKEDWFSEGEGIDYIQREIARLEKGTK